MRSRPTLAEIARHTLKNDFRKIDPRKSRVLLIEAGPRVLSAFTEALSEKARKQLEKLGVEVHTGAAVSEIGEDYVVFGNQRVAARTIANSPLVKTAIHGGDPNWGRLVAAAGRSGAAFVLDRASVSVGPVHVFVNGVPHDERASEAAEVMKASELTVSVDLGTGGSHTATMWTCDFSAEYVRINAEYTT